MRLFVFHRSLFFLRLELIIPIQFIARIAVLELNQAIEPADRIFGKGDAVFRIICAEGIQDGLELLPARQEALEIPLFLRRPGHLAECLHARKEEHLQPADGGDEFRPHFRFHAEHVFHAL